MRVPSTKCFERFSELTEGKMSLLISHRFSTVKMSNRILVLKDGEIAEQGQHDQLLKWAGIMRRCLSCRPPITANF